MPDANDALWAALVSCALTWMLVPVAKRLAIRIGAIDHPKSRGLHSEPTPRLGGLAILVGVLVAGAIWLPWNEETRGILAGVLAIAAVGFMDDIGDLRPALKFAGQAAAATIPVVSDVRIDVITVPFLGSIDLGGLGYPLTVIGIVAVVNVVNFIDGVDGLAAGVCAIAAATFAVIALSLQRYEAGVLAALTAGAALGFLRHGFPPADSFMGDTGSNLLGFLLGVTAVQGALKTNAVVALVFPLLVLAVPILDSTFVIAKRIKYSQPIYQADRWHFHHRLANIGFSQRRTLAYMYGWTLALAGLALALRFVPYSDNHGHFDFLWTMVIAACGILTIAASVYVVYTLQILKLKRSRLAQLGSRRSAAGAPPPAENEVDAGVAHELETGTFAAVDPETGEFKAIDPETGEFEALEPGAHEST